MANTTNFGWETPDDTDLVKDGAAAIRTLGSAIDTSLADLEGGTTGQVLAKNSNTDMDFIWVTSDDANAIQNAIVDAKGDIVAASANDTPARLAVGTDNHRLVAASGETTGLKYVADTQNTVIDAEGDLLVGDAADALQRLAIGSNAQVLTVDTSVDGKIKWATPAGGGSALTFISGATFSSVASVSMPSSTFTSTYLNYLVLLNFTGSSAQQTISCRVNNAGSARTTADYYGARFSINSGGTTTATGTSGQTSFNAGEFRASSDFCNNYMYQVFQPQISTQQTGFSFIGFGGHNGGSTTQNGGCSYIVSESNDGLTWFVSGTFSGSYKVYGIANS